MRQEEVGPGGGHETGRGRTGRVDMRQEEVEGTGRVDMRQEEVEGTGRVDMRQEEVGPGEWT